MMPNLPAWPILPAFLRRQAVELKPEPWPGNPRTVADDLRIAQTNEANLSRLLVAARKDADLEAARAAAFERRATEAEAAHKRVAEQLTATHRDLRELADDHDRLTAANGRLRRQLDRDFGYSDAELAAIANGTGQPRT
jgi:hypothetical protein